MSHGLKVIPYCVLFLPLRYDSLWSRGLFS